MDLAERINSFALLGDVLRRYCKDASGPGMQALQQAAGNATLQNQWFTPGSIRIALNNLGDALTVDNIQRWLIPYTKRLESPSRSLIVGVVMAGNIPAVGFHDFLCVLISGHKLTAKLSSSDNILLPAIAGILSGILPEWHDQISFTDRQLRNFDAIIATGSTNTSRYFELYFGKYPHIIRHNRNSVAILSGSETEDELNLLADDIMLFFGMGCRSISKIYVPEGYDFSPLLLALERYAEYANHNKYRNNYEYNRSIFMVSQVTVLDSGFMLLKEDQSVNSRIGMLHYEYYSNPSNVVDSLGEITGEIQCVVSNTIVPTGAVLPGRAQKPELWDYADHVDTMEFLLSLF